MTDPRGDSSHRDSHRRDGAWQPSRSDLIQVGSSSRRWFLQAGLNGLGGALHAQILRLQTEARGADAVLSRNSDRKSVILVWLSGGPSHLDTWDPKPDAPTECAGHTARSRRASRVFGFCEHLPRQAAIMDKLTVIRSVDCSASTHTPITMQAGNPLARRTNDGRDGAGYPSMGSIAAKFRGPNDPSLPAFVGLADSWMSDVWGAGHMGGAYQPVEGNILAGRFELPRGVTLDRLNDRDALRRQMDHLCAEIDQSGAMEHFDHYTRQAVEMVTSGRARRAFDLEKEDPRLRDAYGRDSLGQKTLLARRLIEAGVTFVLVSGAWGYFDHHGDNVVWGGIEKGLTPLLPRIDQTLATLVMDLERRGLLDQTLVLMMGEFGRSPVINRDAGRDHWTNVMSMVVAGGGLRHGRVIGSTDRKGHAILERKVTPSRSGSHRFHPSEH